MGMTNEQPKLYPLRFDPIYQYRLWGGRRLTELFSAQLPGDGLVGESWLLSDRDDHPSLIADGPLKGKTLASLFHESPEPLLGRLAGHFQRFPLLLKFLDVQKTLSVQVHPSDRQTEYIPAGESGKTEAWVVLEAGPDSRVYAGLKSAMTEDDLRSAVKNQTVSDHLASFQPKLGDSVLVSAGTVHSLADVVVLEVQENSDVTFRLYDWDHVDPKTGKQRPLQVEQALACVDFARIAIGPAFPVVEKAAPVRRERLIQCEHFTVWRITGDAPFTVGTDETPRVLVCLSGDGHVEYSGDDYAVGTGGVLLLPAVVGAQTFQPAGAVTLLEISLPESG
jgi:mannose-6-phosphate isomerase